MPLTIGVAQEVLPKPLSYPPLEFVVVTCASEVRRLDVRVLGGGDDKQRRARVGGRQRAGVLHESDRIGQTDRGEGREVYVVVEWPFISGREIQNRSKSAAAVIDSVLNPLILNCKLWKEPTFVERVRAIAEVGDVEAVELVHRKIDIVSCLRVA